MKYTIYTDGSCQPNPGKGGWAAIIEVQDKKFVRYGSIPECTNNRAELTAALEGLRFTDYQSEVIVVTDSEQVRLAINGMKHPRKNQDLLNEITRLVGGRNVSVEWVRGHAGHPYNERVDSIAQCVARGEDVSALIKGFDNTAKVYP